MIDVKGIPLRKSSVVKPILIGPSGKDDVEGFTRFYIGGNISLDEMKRWTPKQTTDFFQGIAQVVGARGVPK